MLQKTLKSLGKSVPAILVLLGAVAVAGGAETGDHDPVASALSQPPAAAEAMQATYTLDWWSVDGGGGTGTGGGFTLTGTMGQPDAATMFGHGTVADGGLWSGIRVLIFADGFELGDTSEWSITSP